MDKKYLSTTEVGSILGVTNRRVIGLCHEGKLDGASQKGKNWVIPAESVYQYLRNTMSEEKVGKLPCAVGKTSYAELSRDCYYVDKTLLIRDLIDSNSMVTLFTRPRRFGKTLTMNMLQTFFEKTDEDTSVFFKTKKIWQCDEKYRRMQGVYPVVSLTFKDIKFRSWADSFEAIRIILRDEYRRHSELNECATLDQVDKQYLERMQSGTMSEVEYTRALYNLTSMLEKCHQKRVIILIDEYDTLIQQGYSYGFYDEVIGFMRNFLSGGLKDNPSLLFGVLTGILRVSKENLFSGLNNLVVNTVLDNKYSEYFGFTHDEVTAMAEYYGQLDKIEEIQAWYDGYRFGKTDIYNPWSVTNYFANECQAKAFWANTSDNEIIRQLMQQLDENIGEEMVSLLQGNTVQTSLNMEVIYPRMVDGADTIFSFLLVAGYLKIASDVVETESGTFAELTLPNKEIKRVYNTEILSWLRSTLTGNIVAELEKALFLGKAEKIQAALQKYMIGCISNFDGSAEGFYHGMMMGMVATMSSRYYIRSNRESGNGRFDLCLEPRENGLPGIIMEFKAAKDSDVDLNKLAREALLQIEEKHYATELLERGVVNIAKYGLAFSGKNVSVCSE